MLSTSQVAARLGVTETRVRALIAAGALTAERFSGTWVIEEDSVEHLRSRQRRAGHRAMSPRAAWAAAALLDGLDAAWLTSSERSRLRRLLEARQPVDVWIARMARRAVGVTEWWIHPSRMSALLKDERVKASDLHHESVIALGLTEGVSTVTAWVRVDQLDAVSADHHLLASVDPNVRLRAAPEYLASFWSDIAEVPRLVAAADLWDERDPRSQDAARAMFEAATGR